MKAAIITILVILAVTSAFPFAKLRKLARKIVHSKLSIKTTPSTEADIAQVVRGNTHFAFDLFNAVDNNEGNLIYSPYSISVALGMTFAGSNGATKSAIRKTLHFENENIHAVFRDLNSKLVKSEEGLVLKMANSLWSDKEYHFNQDYVELVQNLYQGEAKSVDFKRKGEAARVAINDWTAAQTNDRIKNILASKLPSNTKLVLINAIFFKASWEKPFTSRGKNHFTMLNGATTEADMMKVSQSVNYFQGSEFKSVSIPYKGRKSFMTIILPDEGKFAEVKQNLNQTILSQIFNSNGHKLVDIMMPKFKFETELKLKDTLVQLGMANPFTGGVADFSRMDGTRELFIGNVIHKAFIEVNENGTEAAAATAVIMVTRAAVMRPNAEFIVNRPFIFVIHDENHSVLFMGQVDRPTA